MAYGNSWMGNGYPYYGYPQTPLQPTHVQYLKFMAKKEPSKFKFVQIHQ